MSRDFLITMNDSCLLTSMGWCVCGYGAGIKKCEGELHDRPEWCPLKELREAKSWDYDRRSVWTKMSPGGDV